MPKYRDVTESPVGSEAEIYVGGVKWGKFFKRPDGSWTKDQRKDEDPRHQFDILVHKPRSIGFSVNLTAGAIGDTRCQRCGLSVTQVILDHLKSCPAKHTPIDFQCSWNIVPLCEGERRKVEEWWPSQISS